MKHNLIDCMSIDMFAFLNVRVIVVCILWLTINARFCVFTTQLPFECFVENAKTNSAQKRSAVVDRFAVSHLLAVGPTIIWSNKCLVFCFKYIYRYK